jgi:hypothetical protein
VFTGEPKSNVSLHLPGDFIARRAFRHPWRRQARLSRVELEPGGPRRAASQPGGFRLF